MRRILVAVAAAPLIAGIYAATLVAGLKHHPLVARGVAVLLVVAVGAMTLLEFAPQQANAGRPESVDPGAVARLAVPVVTDFRPNQAVQLDFNVAMDPQSVDEALTVAPGTAVSLKWNDAATSVNVIPTGAWLPGTFYTITVGTGARSQAGQALAQPVRALVLTRSAPTATIQATKTSGGRALTTSSLTITFSRPLDVESVLAAFSIKPAVKGTLKPTALGAAADHFTFVPATALKANATYVVTFTAPLADADGLVLQAARLQVRTAVKNAVPAPSTSARAVEADTPSPSEPIATADPTASPTPTPAPSATPAPPKPPKVVRFRPRDHWTNVAPSQAVSVRFTEPMDHASTQAAFKLSGYDMKKGGTFSWWEGDTVLVFEPNTPLAYGKTYTLSVGPGATSKEGLKIVLPAKAKAVVAHFKVVAKPKPAPNNDNASRKPPKPPVVKPTTDAPWLDVEELALSLLNCTRTGGRVQSDGSCDGYGTGKYSAYVPPLKLNAAISNTVSRPYAKYQADRGYGTCNHFLNGDPGDRFARVGYSSPHWGENIGCRPVSVRSAVIGSAIFFQNEQFSSYRGHWINLKNADYDRVGIGVWEENGWVLSVYDFYRP